MARQPEAVDGMVLDISSMPFGPPNTVEDVIVGDIYRSHSGQPALWWVVGITESPCAETAYYLTFNMRGELVGQSRAGLHYLQKRVKVGHCPIPPLLPEWY